MLVLLLVSIILGACLVLLANYLRVKNHISKETARKLVHFTHALVVIGWPVFVGYWLVILGEILFIFAILISQEYRLFHELRQINRKTWGEFFFPLGVIWLAIVAPPSWVFVACLMLLGLADGMAAIVGQRVKTGIYKIFGQRKTVAGSSAFVAMAMFVMLVVALLSNVDLSTSQYFALIFGVPLLAVIAENLSPYGSDNLTILLVVYFSLKELEIFM